MTVALRRLVWLSVLLGTGYAAVVAWRRRATTADGHAPEWPPFDTVAPAASEPPVGASTVATWVTPTDGNCPIDHPVKANENSGIYHLPGGRFYDRTRAERCYARAEDAEADGYRASRA